MQFVGFGLLEQDIGTVTDQGHSNFPHRGMRHRHAGGGSDESSTRCPSGRGSTLWGENRSRRGRLRVTVGSSGDDDRDPIAWAGPEPRRPGFRPLRHDDSRHPPSDARPRRPGDQPRPARRRRALPAAPAPGPIRGRCPMLLSDHALGSLPKDRKAEPASAELEQRDVAAVLHRPLPGRLPLPFRLPRAVREDFSGARAADADEGAAADRRRSSTRRSRRPSPERAAARSGRRRAGLPTSRPPSGWFGGRTPGRRRAMSAVLRSWEDRFGAVLVRMGRATLELAVAAPPWEPSECLAVAAEHYAFCDDTLPGQPRHAAGLREPAARIHALELLVELTGPGVRFCRCPSLPSPRARPHGP